MRARPFLSIVVPAFNEEAVIGRFIESVRCEVDASGVTWEAIIIDDGSADRTAAIAMAAARADERVRLVSAPHLGKGAAVRAGFAAAGGDWVLMADADLSMPWDNLRRFLDLTAETGPPPQIIIGSREAPGAVRTGEAATRRISGRIFNALVRLVALPGIRDSQCGYKMLSSAAIELLLPHLTLDGFAFDVELLYLARLAGLRVREVGIVCHCRQDSRVRLLAGIRSFADVLRVRVDRRGAREALEKVRGIGGPEVRPTSYSGQPSRPAPATSRDIPRDSSYTRS